MLGGTVFDCAEDLVLHYHLRVGKPARRHNGPRTVGAVGAVGVGDAAPARRGDLRRLRERWAAGAGATLRFRSAVLPREQG